MDVSCARRSGHKGWHSTGRMRDGKGMGLGPNEFIVTWRKYSR